MNSFNGFANSIRNIYYVIRNYVYNFPAVDASLVFYYPLDSSNGSINAGTANYASGLPVYDASMMGLAMNAYNPNNFVTGLGDLSLNNVMGSAATAYVKSDTSFNLVPSTGLSISMWVSCSAQDVCGTLISLYQNKNNIDSSIIVGLYGSKLFSGYNTVTNTSYIATGTYTTSTYGNYTILKYTSGSGTFKPTNTNLKVGYLVVGGGSKANPWGFKNNAGSFNIGGAGGNGGAITYSSLSQSNLTINNNITCNIVVGSGSTSTGTDGNASSLNATIVAQGGTKIYSSSFVTQYGNYYRWIGDGNTATATGGINNFPGGNHGNGGSPTSSSGSVGKLVIISDINISANYGGGGGGGGGGTSSTVANGSVGGNGGTDGLGANSIGSDDRNNVNQGNPGISNFGSGGGGGGGFYKDAYETSIGSNGGDGGSGVVIIYFPTRL